VILSDDQIAEAERAARQFQGAWTGTSGTLASWVVHLIDTIRAERRAMADLHRQPWDDLSDGDEENVNSREAGERLCEYLLHLNQIGKMTAIVVCITAH
jgi:hypothetical protein